MAKEIHETIGRHYIVEASGCDPKIIGSVVKVQQILVKAGEDGGRPAGWVRGNPVGG